MAIPGPYRGAVAVPLPDDQVVRDAVGADFDSAATLNVVQMMTGTGDMFPALVGMVRAVFGADDIDARHREVIILRAAVVFDSPYEWQANEKMAANAGLTPEEIRAVAADGPVEGMAADYVLLCRAADEMYGATHTLSDATLSELLDTFGADLTRRYIVTISWFSLLSLFLNATRVPLETKDKIGDRTSPL